ncbi:MAG TPA: DUF5615 family PIN-like protein [Candidatus Nanoarchaeia archaeon]
MKAVVDEDLPRSLELVLQELGWKVLSIRDHLRGSSDEEVASFAKNNKAVLFSADLGFANIIRFPLGAHYGIVISRFPNEISTYGLVDEIKKALSQLSIEIIKGNLIIIEPGKIRIRKTKV